MSIESQACWVGGIFSKLGKPHILVAHVTNDPVLIHYPHDVVLCQALLAIIFYHVGQLNPFHPNINVIELDILENRSV